MKLNLIILAFVTIGMMISCDKTETSNEIEFESTGTIMGSDKGLCPCCGGWILQIDNDENSYRFENLPQDSDIELNENHVSVKFNWSIDRECGGLIYIILENIMLN